jgi:archaetidylinositol phosphate synthase
MTISTDNSAPGTLAAAESRRAGRELVLEWIFQPLSSLLVPVLQRLRMPPPAIVLANATAGLLAALAIARDVPVAAALLLQLKTLLDNCDGRVARESGRVTLAGRYLDTFADLVVNAVLFVALAHVTGKPFLALAAFVSLTLVLSVDFNLSELARAAYGVSAREPRATDGRGERLLAAVYAAVFAPQDRAVRAISDRRFASAVGAEAPPEARRAYFDPLTRTVLANVGLTTQLAALGVCLVVGQPTLYLWLALASFLVLSPLQLRRERLARRVAAR